jgi:hypothetical protein
MQFKAFVLNVTTISTEKQLLAAVVHFGNGRHRQTNYIFPELALKICSRIAEGESVRTIVHDDDMPASSTISRWLLDEDKKDFWEQYEKARNIQAENMFEELLEIADDGTNDWMEKENRDGSSYYVINGEAMGRSRLRVDVRKWYLSKVLPKKFSDKLDLTSDNKPLAATIIGMRIINDVKDTTTEGDRISD